MTAVICFYRGEYMHCCNTLPYYCPGPGIREMKTRLRTQIPRTRPAHTHASSQVAHTLPEPGLHAQMPRASLHTKFQNQACTHKCLEHARPEVGSTHKVMTRTRTAHKRPEPHCTHKYLERGHQPQIPATSLRTQMPRIRPQHT